ncbi:MAG: hypothetical protein Q8O49_00745 [bacterium]|nr:hypothetical protein [bacterium]
MIVYKSQNVIIKSASDLKLIEEVRMENLIGFLIAFAIVKLIAMSNRKKEEKERNDRG